MLHTSLLYKIVIWLSTFAINSYRSLQYYNNNYYSNFHCAIFPFMDRFGSFVRHSFRYFIIYKIVSIIHRSESFRLIRSLQWNKTERYGSHRPTRMSSIDKTKGKQSDGWMDGFITPYLYHCRSGGLILHEPSNEQN